MLKALSTEVIFHVDGIEFAYHEWDQKDKRNITPKYERKEVLIVALAHTIVGELAVMVQVLNTSIASAAMVNSVV